MVSWRARAPLPINTAHTRHAVQSGQCALQYAQSAGHQSCDVVISSLMSARTAARSSFWNSVASARETWEGGDVSQLVPRGWLRACVRACGVRGTNRVEVAGGDK